MGTGVSYREGPQITVPSRASGTASTPSVMFARGTVVIDGGDSPRADPNRWVPRYADSTSTIKLWAAKDTSSDSDHHCNQVIMYSASLAMERRYTENNNSNLTQITVGQSHFNGVDTVYVYFDDPSHDYSTDNGFLCTRGGIRLRASNFVLDGFTILRSRFDGVLADTTALRNVAIKNCTITQSLDDGIDLSRCTACVVSSNTSAENTRNGILLHSRTAFATVESCTVINNACYSNNNQSKADNTSADDINGIRIGSSPDSTGFSYHAIVNNRAYSNEDTGIDVRGSKGNTFRYNQSWFNGDHGFDHLASSYNRHIGDLAYANGHDGFSFENNSPVGSIRNCIAVDNGRATNQQDYELEVIGAARDSFVGDYDIIYRPTGRSGSCGSWSEERDTILVAWRAKDDQGGCQVRCSYSDSCFGTVVRFAAASINPGHNELHSKQGDPLFVDASASNFRLKTNSPGIDAADTTTTGWQTTDLLGFGRYDCRLVGNTGQPSASFADIGPYEHDDGAPVIDAVVNYNTADISWMARGATGDEAPPPAYHEVYVNDVKKNVSVAPAPGTGVVETVGLSLCATSTVYVITVDSDSLRAKSNTLTLQTCCGQGCYGTGPGGPALTHASREEVDYPLALASPGPNPTGGTMLVSWSIPRAEAGAAYELSMFDVAGRKVSTLSSGLAKAGKFAHELNFRSWSGTQLPNGVFYLRLKVGKEVVTRPVVLTR